MQLRYIDEVQKSLGSSTLELLNAMFTESIGIPPAVPAKRFRADHPEWMDQLINMGSSNFLVKCDWAIDTYRVSAYVLPLVDSIHASKILGCMETIYKYLREHYNKHLDQPLAVADLFEAARVEQTLFLETLSYMRDVDGWWSQLSNDFPFKADATFAVNERVLQYKSFAELIERVYEWNFIKSTKRHSISVQFFLDRWKHNKVVTLLAAIAALVILVGNVTDAVSKTKSFFAGLLKQPAQATQKNKE